MADASGEPLGQAFTLERYGSHLGRGGRWDEALTMFRRSIAVYATTGARGQQAMNITRDEYVAGGQR